MSGSAVEAATALKDKGNAAFAGGDVEGCLARYGEALALLEGDDAAAARSLAALLLSNSANAHLSVGRWAEASDCAARAIDAFCANGVPAAGTNEATLLDKARFRRARAEHEQGLAFSALCELMLITKPTADAAALVAKVARDVGLMGLDSAFGIHIFEGGYTAVAREDIAPDTALFAEGQLLVEIDATLGESEGGSATTESRVAAFVKELIALRAKGADGRAKYDRVAKEMKGSWPRRLSDLPPSVLQSVRDAAAATFAEASGADDALPGPSVCGAGITTVRDEVTLVALQARYNCFHRGFFRACALMNHACDANAAMKYQPGSSLALASHRESLGASLGTGVVTLVACRRIRKGEPITVKYLADHDFVLGVVPRRELLRASWLFTCECNRCNADMQPDAKTEWLRCTATEGCAGFVHLPVAPIDGRECSDAVADMKRACGECGAQCGISPELRLELHELRRDMLDVHSGVQSPDGRIDSAKLFAGVLRLRRATAKRCHPSHWLHTLCLYQYCVAAQRRVEQVFAEVSAAAPAERPKLAADAAREFGLSRFDAAAVSKQPIREPADEVDALALFLELEARLLPYYPPTQLWALHVAGGRLAVLCAVAHPDRFPALAPIITAKANFFPSAMRPATMALLKGADIPAKQLKSLSRTL